MHRREGDRWINDIVRGIEATLALNSVPLTISMSELYEGIPLPQPRVPAVDMR